MQTAVKVVERTRYWSGVRWRRVAWQRGQRGDVRLTAVAQLHHTRLGVDSQRLGLSVFGARRKKLYGHYFVAVLLLFFRLETRVVVDYYFVVLFFFVVVVVRGVGVQLVLVQFAAQIDRVLSVRLRLIRGFIYGQTSWKMPDEKKTI